MRFSFFKSLNRSKKKRRHQNLSAAGVLAKVKVSSYARIIHFGFILQVEIHLKGIDKILKKSYNN